MPNSQVLTVTVLVAVFTWSAVMAALGQLAAVTALVPSLGLLVQQIDQIMSRHEARHEATREAITPRGEAEAHHPGDSAAAVAAPPRPQPAVAGAAVEARTRPSSSEHGENGR